MSFIRLKTLLCTQCWLSLAHHMGPQILFSVLFCLIAAANAGQLSLQSPKLTVIGPDGGKLRSEQYVTCPYSITSTSC